MFTYRIATRSCRVATSRPLCTLVNIDRRRPLHSAHIARLPHDPSEESTRDYYCSYMGSQPALLLVRLTCNFPSSAHDYYCVAATDDIDQHGQLFLSGTKIRNFTSCYKDPAFLDFFYKRLKPLPASRTDTLAEDRLAELKQEGYTFISLCGQERNFIRCQDTPIVFRELMREGENWNLKYGGSLKTPFQPDNLKVDERGYLYHPSPISSVSRQRKPKQTSNKESNDGSQENPYGKYSLLRSELVISHFGKTLEIADDGKGSFDWLGNRRNIGQLEGGEPTRGEGRID